MQPTTPPPAPPAGRRAVASVGETMVLLTPDPPGSLADARQLSVHVGGAESNVALYLADHGVPARWLSRVGDDPFGARILDCLTAAGVDVTGVEVDPDRPTGVYFKHRTADGAEVRYYRRGSAAAAMDRAILDHPAARTADVLHLTGITPALSTGCLDLVRTALGQGPGRAPLVSFDVNWRPSLWPDHPGRLLLDLARGADVVFVGLDEAAALWGSTDAGSVRDLLPAPRLLVVKDGGRPATAFGPGGTVRVPALHVEVVDVVGAGDAFAAGVLAGLVGGLDPVRRLRLGHLTAAAALRVPADHGPLPDPAVRQRLLHCDDGEWAAAVIPGVSPAPRTPTAPTPTAPASAGPRPPRRHDVDAPPSVRTPAGGDFEVVPVPPGREE